MPPTSSSRRHRPFVSLQVFILSASMLAAGVGLLVVISDGFSLNNQAFDKFGKSVSHQTHPEHLSSASASIASDQDMPDELRRVMANGGEVITNNTSDSQIPLGQQPVGISLSETEEARKQRLRQRIDNDPALADSADLMRQRLSGAAQLGRLARQGNATAARAVKDIAATETDPRLLSALNTGTIPHFGEEISPVRLPSPAAAALPRTLDVEWGTFNLDQSRSYHANGGAIYIPDLQLNVHANRAHSSQVVIQPDGRAMVETRTNDGWHVRFPAYAWDDADGNTIIDARGSPVQVIVSSGGNWSPDSMIIRRNGTVEFEDDRRMRGNGSVPVSRQNPGQTMESDYLEQDEIQ